MGWRLTICIALVCFQPVVFGKRVQIAINGDSYSSSNINNGSTDSIHFSRDEFAAKQGDEDKRPSWITVGGYESRKQVDMYYLKYNTCCCLFDPESQRDLSRRARTIRPAQQDAFLVLERKALNMFQGAPGVYDKKTGLKKDKKGNDKVEKDIRLTVKKHPAKEGGRDWYEIVHFQGRIRESSFRSQKLRNGLKKIDWEFVQKNKGKWVAMKDRKNEYTRFKIIGEFKILTELQGKFPPLDLDYCEPHPCHVRVQKIGRKPKCQMRHRDGYDVNIWSDGKYPESIGCYNLEMEFLKEFSHNPDPEAGCNMFPKIWWFPEDVPNDFDEDGNAKRPLPIQKVYMQDVLQMNSWSPEFKVLNDIANNREKQQFLAQLERTATQHDNKARERAAHVAAVGEDTVLAHELRDRYG